MSNEIRLKGKLSPDFICDTCEQPQNEGKQTEILVSTEELASQLTFEEAFQILYHNPNKKDLPQQPTEKYCKCKKPKYFPYPNAPLQAGHREDFCYHCYKLLPEKPKEEPKKIGEFRRIFLAGTYNKLVEKLNEVIRAINSMRKERTER